MSRGVAIRIMILAEAATMGIAIAGIKWSWDNPDVWWFGCICVLAALFDVLMTISTFEMLVADERRKRRKNESETD